jgi:WD40 repeat protein
VLNNKQPRAFEFIWAVIICSAFVCLLVACSQPPKAQVFPTASIIPSVPVASTEQMLSPTAPPQAFTNTPSTETTISRIATFGKFDSDVKKVVISDDGKTLAAIGGKNDQLIVWNLESGNELLTLKEHNDWNFALSADGHLLASTTWGDSWITVRDIQTGQKLQRIKGIRIVQDLAFSPDGNVLAIDGGSAIWLWDIQNNKLLDYLGPESDAIGVLAFSRDGKQLVSVGNFAAQLWDLSSRKAIETIRLSKYHMYWGASVSPGNPYYMAISYESSVVDQNLDRNSVEIWDMKEGNLVRTIAEFGVTGTPMAISPDGRFLAVTQSTRNQIWDVSSGKPIYKFQPDWAIFAFSADGYHLAVGNLDGTVELWDVSQLK